jgi:hypothetical protein
MDATKRPVPDAADLGRTWGGPNLPGICFIFA